MQELIRKWQAQFNKARTMVKLGQQLLLVDFVDIKEETKVKRMFSLGDAEWIRIWLREKRNGPK